MAEGEKIDIVKAVTSPLTGLYWVKTIMYVLGAFALLFVGYCIWHTLFKKPMPNQAITVQPGGQVTIHNEPQKKAWWIPSPFVEVYTFVQSNDDKGVGGRFGARWDW